MVSAQIIPKLNILTNNTFTLRELSFITSYLASGNASQAVRDAGYKSKAPESYAYQINQRDSGEMRK